MHSPYVDFGGWMELSGKVALVTGGAQRVGRAIALAVAARGLSVVVHYGESVTTAQQTADEIRTMGVDALALQADLASPEAIAVLFRNVSAHFHRLDVLVNSAASFHKATFSETSVADWDAVMAANLRAPFLCMQHAVPLMQSGGVIVNISDLAGIYAWRNYTAHGVSKAGLIHLTKQAARELAPTIRVNSIVPGPILPAPGMDDKTWEAVGERVPLKRNGSPRNIVQTVLFLLENDYMTGESIIVDGGEALDGPAWH